MPHRTSIDLATGETLAFVRLSLLSTARRILEVGCGDGRLAAALHVNGLDVTAIDSDPDSIERARTRNVNAHIARFDAVGILFQ